MIKSTISTATYIQTKGFSIGHGVVETFAIIGITDRKLPFSRQLDCVWDRFLEFHKEHSELVPVFERWFLSDAAQQQAAVQDLRKDSGNAVSIVEQPLLDGTKVALLVYMQTDVELSAMDGGIYMASHNAYDHIWACSCTAEGESSKEQARDILMKYGCQLSDCGNTLVDNCVRTWFFVSDIDVNYHGVVVARNEVFATQGLTRDTHFIASTGIGGRCAIRNCSVLFDAYAVGGTTSDQIQYLQAPEYLNPTYEYGVSFERGTAVSYGDRKHIFISGTASINNLGNIVYPGDVVGQTGRMLENVSALLRTAGADMSDVMHVIVYLRDMADYQVVSELLDKELHGIPFVITYAPVCRPGWLIEMECMAITPDGDSRFRDL